ncbi:hypothetical protein PFLG_03016 [Plasmodium falciparum RAJ116]|uniref:Uncharacterized protein n=1 Tax=Plasmodium falciparum RAJ116 TaxID=580058 RepID=A0A0L0D0Q4_PLAFA|nr:hypothetical protein PFLG_03016 [Plasmodium falciparum RAJ116]
MIKPFLHFLFTYVYMGINKDYSFEYIINTNEVAHFFFIFHNGKKYFDPKYLLSDVSLLSSILRVANEEYFFLSIPKKDSRENEKCTQRYVDKTNSMISITTPNIKKQKEKNDKYENVFIKYWNDEKECEVAYEKIKLDINKKLEKDLLIFYNMLSNHVNGMCLYDKRAWENYFEEKKKK